VVVMWWPIGHLIRADWPSLDLSTAGLRAGRRN
jgi:hypothetical protein